MEANCPNCGKAIAVVTPAELDSEYGITPNALQHARERGSFPDPWLSFSNRNVYLASDIEAYKTARGQAQIDRKIDEMLSALASLPDEQAELIERRLSERLKAR